jgi:xylose dehydrogenase (NAD/NADP)
MSILEKEATREPETRPVRFGVLGAARIARSFVEGVAPAENISVVAVASRDKLRAESFARETGIARLHESYQDLLADPEVEAIYNPLPNALHAPWCIRACEAGKHVLCEKPLALSAAEARSMFDAARANGVLLFEAYPYLCQPQTTSLRRMIAAGELGRLRVIQAAFGFTLMREGDIRLEAALGGGALLDVGSYPVSLVRVLAGAPPVRVRAVTTPFGIDVDGTTVAILEHADGLIAQIMGSFETALYRGALILGDAGSVETNFGNHISPDPSRPSWLRIKRGVQEATPELVSHAPSNGFRLEAESFAKAVRLGPQHWAGATPEQSVDIALALEAILESARTGHPVTL